MSCDVNSLRENISGIHLSTKQLCYSDPDYYKNLGKSKYVDSFAENGVLFISRGAAMVL